MCKSWNIFVKVISLSPGNNFFLFGLISITHLNRYNPPSGRSVKCFLEIVKLSDKFVDKNCIMLNHELAHIFKMYIRHTYMESCTQISYSSYRCMPQNPENCEGYVTTYVFVKLTWKTLQSVYVHTNILMQRSNIIAYSICICNYSIGIWYIHMCTYLFIAEAFNHLCPVLNICK